MREIVREQTAHSSLQCPCKLLDHTNGCKIKFHDYGKLGSPTCGSGLLTRSHHHESLLSFSEIPSRSVIHNKLVCVIQGMHLAFKNLFTGCCIFRWLYRDPVNLLLPRWNQVSGKQTSEKFRFIWACIGLDLHVELQLVVTKRFVASLGGKTNINSSALAPLHVFAGLQIDRRLVFKSCSHATPRVLAENCAEEVIRGRVYQR